MADKTHKEKEEEMPFQKRFQPTFKGTLLKSFMLYSQLNEISYNDLINVAVKEKLIKENAYRVGRISGHQGTG